MLILGGYQSEGTMTDEKTGRQNHYDSVTFFCFADKWDKKIGLNDTDYIRFGTPVKIVKVPTADVVASLGIPFALNESSRDVLRKFDFENKLIGGEILPVYNEKGKIDSVSFSFADGSNADVPSDSISVESLTMSEFSDKMEQAASSEASDKKSKKS